MDSLKCSVQLGDVQCTLERLEVFYTLRYFVPAEQARELVFRLHEMMCSESAYLCLTPLFSAVLRRVLKQSRRVLGDLRLPWRPLYDLLRRTCRATEKSGTHMISAAQTDLMRLVKYARRFFAPEAAQELMVEFEVAAVKFTRLDMGIHRAAVFLALFCPRRVDAAAAPRLLLRWLEVWGWVERNSSWNLVWAGLVKRTVRHNQEAFRALASTYAQTVFTQVLAVIVGSSAADGAAPLSFNSVDAMLFSLNEFSDSLRSAAKLAAAAITVWRAEVHTHFRQLIHACSHSFHPLPANETPSDLLPFLSSLVRTYVKWAQADDLPEAEREHFARIVLADAVFPSVFVNHQPRDSRPCRTLMGLAYLCPRAVLPPLLDRVWPIITNAPTVVYRPTHYLPCALEALAVVMPVLVKWPGAAAKLADFLTLTLPAIDPNDLAQTNAVLKFYFRFLTCVPLYAAKQPLLRRRDSAGNLFAAVAAPGVEEPPELRVCAVFPEFASQVLDRLFRFLQTQDEVYTSHMKPEEGTFNVIFQLFARTFFMQLSPELFAVALQKLCTLLRTTSLPVCAWKLAAILCFSAVNAHPQKALDTFFPLLRTQLVDGASTAPAPGEPQLTDVTDIEAQWWLYMLGKSVALAGPALLRYRSEMLAILAAAYAHHSKKVRQAGAKALKETLWSLCSIYPMDFRSLPPDRWSASDFASGGHAKQWGDYAGPGVACVWHEPSRAELDFAGEIASHFLDRAFAVLRAAGDGTLRPATVPPGCGEGQTSPGDIIYAALDAVRVVLVGASDALPNAVPAPSTPGLVDGETGAMIRRRLKITAHGMMLERNVRLEVAQAIHTALQHLKTSPHCTVPILLMVTKIINFVVGNVCGDVYFLYRESYRRIRRKWKTCLAGDPGPRCLNVDRVYVQHMFRVYKSRFDVATPTDPVCEALTFDLLELTTGAYDVLGDTASDVLTNCIERQLGPPNAILNKTLEKLCEPPSTDNGEGATLGAAVLLLSSAKLKYDIIDNWQNLLKFITVLGQSNALDQHFTSSLLSKLLREYACSFMVGPLRLPPEQPLPEGDPHSELLQQARAALERRYEQDRVTYAQIMDMITSQKSNDHWRFQLISSLWFTMLVQLAPGPLPAPWLQWLMTGLRSEFTDHRILCTLALLSVVLNSDYDGSDLVSTLDVTGVLESMVEGKKFAPASDDGAGDDAINSEDNYNWEALVSVLLGFCKLLNSSWPTHTGLESENFSVITAYLFQSLTRRHGKQFVDKCEAAVGQIKVNPGEEEAAQCVLAELVAGVVRAGRSREPEPFWVNLLRQQLRTTTPTSAQYWASCIQYITRGRDAKSIEWMTRFIGEDLRALLAGDDGEGFRYLTNYLKLVSAVTVETCLPGLFLQLLTEADMRKCLEHPYKAIRIETACLLSVLLAICAPVQRSGNGSSSGDSPLGDADTHGTVLRLTRSLCQQVAAAPDSEAASSLFSLVQFSIQCGWVSSLLFVLHDILLALFALQSSSKEEIALNGRSTLIVLAQNIWPVEENPLCPLSMVLAEVEGALTHPNWHNRKWVSLFVDMITPSYAFKMTVGDVRAYCKIVQVLLRDPQLEVRKRAAVNLESLLIGPCPLGDGYALIDGLVDQFAADAKSTTPEIRHGAILGLAAILGSSALHVLPYTARVIELLAAHGYERPPVGDTITEAFRSFWQSIQHSWERYQHLLTDYQYSAIRGHLTPPPYYA
eukprot:TRINITY_DN4812_c0_g2_i1.p1 TRINITY_DN4812_c0_g2~~TRINITY_DN4812_c0_g2_i1.p1  ORF type:complete len:1713 (-),score=442.30 TRINITY_DN4812_c0_g2_i1:156-5294(-)